MQFYLTNFFFCSPCDFVIFTEDLLYIFKNSRATTVGEKFGKWGGMEENSIYIRIRC